MGNRHPGHQHQHSRDTQGMGLSRWDIQARQIRKSWSDDYRMLEFKAQERGAPVSSGRWGLIQQEQCVWIFSPLCVNRSSRGGQRPCLPCLLCVCQGERRRVAGREHEKQKGSRSLLWPGAACVAGNLARKKSCYVAPIKSPGPS